MPRVARIMTEGWPFHIVHRGNHRRAVFFIEDDYRAYLDMLRRYAQMFQMKLWAYCLMPNHVHILAVGCQRLSIPRAVGNAHREFSRQRNAARQLTGHSWANRYFSTILDEVHLRAAVRYVELNPVRAGLVERAVDYPWSSARAHAGTRGDPLLDPARPFPGPVADWAGWLELGLEDVVARYLRENTQSGRPSGSEEFVTRIETRLGRARASDMKRAAT